jgi:hypothetical protein
MPPNPVVYESGRALFAQDATAVNYDCLTVVRLRFRS